MKNKLGFLGFLGLLGILGFITHNNTYFWFFALIYYFKYFWIIPDELFKHNIRKAATPAFFVGMIIFFITGALTALHISTLVYVIGLAAASMASILTFTFTLVLCELKECREKQT